MTKTKTCCKCGVEKQVEEFHRAIWHTDGIMSRCKPCVNNENRNWYARNRERERARARELYSKYKVIRRITNRVSYRKRKERILEYRKSFIKNTKIQVISHYSQGLNKCALCDEKRLVCLTIDHIKGGGNKHRKEIKVASGTSFARWLIVNNFPEGYRILCMNCQFAEVDRLRKVKYHGEE